MPNSWVVERYRNATIILLLIHVGLIGLWMGLSVQYLNNHPHNSKPPFEMEIGKLFFTWLTYGSRLFIMDYRPRTRMYVNIIFVVLYLGLYVPYMALGTTMGVGEVCRANIGLCFLDHLCTTMALVIIGLIVFDVVVSAGWQDNCHLLRRLRLSLIPARRRPPHISAPFPLRSAPVPLRSTPVPPRPARTPFLPTPWSKPEQHKVVSGLDQQSIMSSATTLQGEETQIDKDKKCSSTITIYSIDGHEPDPLLEQIIHNPTSGNPVSKPNQGL